MTLQDSTLTGPPSQALQSSPYQQAIFDWIAKGAGHGLVLAVAGSGKTTTLVEASRYLQTDSALFCAFNKHIQEELSRRLQRRMHCTTIHSLGLSALRAALPSSGIDADKYWTISREVLQERLPLMGGARFQPGNFMRWLRATVDAVHYARVTLTPVKEETSLQGLAAQFGLDIAPKEFAWWHAGVREVLRLGLGMAKDQGILDFDDMIWLPWQWQLTPHKYAWVFVDECQDLSAAQLDLVAKSLAKEGRLLCVGDERQAIYGFAGADAYSIQRIRDRFAPTELPLSVTYRCPRVVVSVAQLFASEIEPRPQAPEGLVQIIAPESLSSMLQEGDLVLGRRTAPLVETCIDLLGRQIHARVQGRGIGKELVDHLKQLALHDPITEEMLDEALGTYEERGLKRLEQQANPGARISAFLDQISALAACFQAFAEARTIQGLRQKIEQLFSDVRTPITLSTVHRAKGLEAERVFLIYPHELPLTWEGQQEWEYHQELNLKYVAVTRVRTELLWVSATGRTADEWAAYGLGERPAPATQSPVTSRVPESVAIELATGTPIGEIRPLPKEVRSQWRIGQRVLHPHFGTGIIKAVSNSQVGPVVRIAFESGKSRQIATSVVRLELLD